MQAGETVHQQGGVHDVATTYYNDYNIPRRIDLIWILRTFKTKLHTNSTDWSNDAKVKSRLSSMKMYKY